MENEEEIVDSQNDTEVTETTEEEVESTESTIDLDAEIKKATAPLYARMKQAELEAKELKSKLASNPGDKPSEGLAQKDVIYLAKADIHEDDIDEVIKHAQAYKISLKEAHEYLKPILSVKQENRKTAQATNTGNVRRGAVKINPTEMLDKARRGEKVEDYEALAQARLEERKAANKR